MGVCVARGNLKEIYRILSLSKENSGHFLSHFGEVMLLTTEREGMLVWTDNKLLVVKDVLDSFEVLKQSFIPVRLITEAKRRNLSNAEIIADSDAVSIVVQKPEIETSITIRTKQICVKSWPLEKWQEVYSDFAEIPLEHEIPGWYFKRLLEELRRINRYEVAAVRISRDEIETIPVLGWFEPLKIKVSLRWPFEVPVVIEKRIANFLERSEKVMIGYKKQEVTRVRIKADSFNVVFYHH
jgi:hypothetical protein